MPRGRPKKPRLSRMDAAIDAMMPLGFPKLQVQKTVKNLLKEYGGEDAWPFIEEYSYKELIDAILRDAVAQDGNQVMVLDESFEDERTVGTSTNVSDTQHDKMPENNVSSDVAITTVGVVTESACSEVVTNFSGIHNEVGDNAITSECGKGWKDILPDQILGHVEKKMSVAGIVCKAEEDSWTETNPEKYVGIADAPSQAIVLYPQPNNISHPPPKRLPCYGWIESDEEITDVSYICLRPAPALEKSRTNPHIPEYDRKRKSS